MGKTTSRRMQEAGKATARSTGEPKTNGNLAQQLKAQLPPEPELDYEAIADKFYEPHIDEDIG